MSSSIRFLDAGLQHEYEAVHRHLMAALTDLQPPLGVLVQAQLDESLSPERAGAILTAAFGQPDSAQLREQRILLASALEMLHLALCIHHILLQTNNQDVEQEVDKTWIGSIILAGDYCFSRAAILAAATDKPAVVEIFARALQRVSEDHLRQLFHSTASSPLQNELLIRAGLSAASVLVGRLASEGDSLASAVWALLSEGDAPLDSFPLHQAMRWQAVQQVAAAP
jgi:hypothetical protein